MTTVIKGYFPNHTKRKRSVSIKCFEDEINQRIIASQARTERFQRCDLWEEAGIEIAYQDGLAKALKVYKEWALN